MTQVRLDLTKELSTLDKVRMIRDAQRQVGPGGRVEILAFKDDDQRFVFQGVHMILDGDHQRPWKKDERRESRIVFIGRNLPGKLITEGFESCFAK